MSEKYLPILQVFVYYVLSPEKLELELCNIALLHFFGCPNNCIFKHSYEYS